MKNMWILSISALLLVVIAYAKTPPSGKILYVKNTALQTLNTDPDWLGNPINEQGRFLNLYDNSAPNFADVIEWKRQSNPYQPYKKADEFALPVVKDPQLFTNREDAIVWLGHASFLIRLEGITLLTDPVFFDRFFLKRLSELPFDLQDLQNIDYILLSHGHFDHCDLKSLAWIKEKCPQATVLTGLGMEKILKNKFSESHIQTAGWYQQYKTPASISIAFVPAKHWTKRSIADQNKALWGGFSIKTDSLHVYFMGDSGYDAHFKDIASLCGAPDYAIIGVGAFEPEWFMHNFHISPLNALKAAEEMQARYFIPMHYGTFDLSDEPLLEPRRILQNMEHTTSLQLLYPNPGETIVPSANKL
jgi:L-ascorbate metabolism protein UlaG (beta-lactamase superfamily)